MKPLELGKALAEAKHRLGLTNDELSAKFNIPLRTVERLLSRVKYPEKIQGAIDKAYITFSHAEVLKEFNIQDPEKWIRRIMAKHLDANALRRELMEERGQGSPARQRQYLRKRDGITELRVRITERTLESELRRMLEDVQRFEEEIEKLLP